MWHFLLSKTTQFNRSKLTQLFSQRWWENHFDFGRLHIFFFLVWGPDHFFYLGNLAEKRFKWRFKLTFLLHFRIFFYFISIFRHLKMDYRLTERRILFFDLIQIDHRCTQNRMLQIQIQNSDSLVKCSKAVKQKILIYCTFIVLHTHFLCVCLYLWHCFQFQSKEWFVLESIHLHFYVK